MQLSERRTSPQELSAACLLCGTPCGEIMPGYDDVRDYFIAGGHSDSFSLRQCSRCGVVFTCPPLSNDALANYYPEDYEAYTPRRDFRDFLQRLKYQSDLRLIKKFTIPSKRSLFEIGSGRGEFLFFARQHGFDVAGIEPGRAGVDFAKNTYNIEVQHGFSSQVDFSRPYDIIVLRHVLEHLNDGAELLAKIAQGGLRKKGILFLKIPRFDSWERRFFGKCWSGLDAPRHRLHFTRAALIKVLNEHGFEVVDFRQEIVPTDIVRSVQYSAKHHPRRAVKWICRVANSMPHTVKLCAAQGIGITLAPLQPGRMIVIATRV